MPDLAGQRGGPAARPVLAVLAFLFVVLALVALAVAPSVLLKRVSRSAREEASTILPAAVAMSDLMLAMKERTVAARSGALTGDPTYDARYAQQRRTEEAALVRLEEMAPRLSGAFAGHVAQLRRLKARKDVMALETTPGSSGAATYRAALPRFNALHDSALVQVEGLRREMQRLRRERAAEQARQAEQQRWISLLLGTVAVLASGVVGWFAWAQLRLRRQVQGALEEANRQRAIAERHREELQRATEARVRLLRGITHDVKNPLGAAKGYAELLEMGIKAPMLPAQAPMVEGVQRSVDRALDIIGDLLDLVRAESGGLQVEPVDVDLRAVARAAAEDHRAAAEAAGHAIRVVAADDPVEVHTDPARVEQVLGNLLSNAVKYTPPPGRITVAAEVADGDAAGRPGPWAMVRVADTGPGIPERLREAVFDEFTRLEDDGPQQGHGLGLAIARRVARLLGGDLTVRDADGGGAEFVLWLPMGREEDGDGADGERCGGDPPPRPSPTRGDGDQKSVPAES